MIGLSDADVARLWASVEKSETCWLWQGYRKNGYGVMSVGNRPAYVHRLVYEIHHKREIPPSMLVCHTCDVKLCVRPGHLFLGADRDNVADMWAKGRAVPPPVRFGEQHPKARLSDAAVAQIRDLYAARVYNQHELAGMFNVSQSTVWRLVHRKVRA